MTRWLRRSTSPMSRPWPVPRSGMAARCSWSGERSRRRTCWGRSPQRVVERAARRRAGFCPSRRTDRPAIGPRQTCGSLPDFPLPCRGRTVPEMKIQPEKQKAAAGEGSLRLSLFRPSKNLRAFFGSLTFICRFSRRRRPRGAARRGPGRARPACAGCSAG